MSTDKPKPKKVDGRLQYTLTSYEPVSIKVTIPFVTRTEVEQAIDRFAKQAGLKRSQLTNEWVAKNFDKISTYAEFFRDMRDGLSKSAIEQIEQDKRRLCSEELAKRLEQDIDHDDYVATRKGLELTALEGKEATEVGDDEIISKTSLTPQAFQEFLDEHALIATRQNAALDAWVQWRKLKADEFELPALLELDVERCGEIVANSKATGSFDVVMDMALRNKALNSIVAECSCTYHRETEAEGEERVKRMSGMSDGPSSKPEFKLV